MSDTESKKSTDSKLVITKVPKLTQIEIKDDIQWVKMYLSKKSRFDISSGTQVIINNNRYVIVNEFVKNQDILPAEQLMLTLYKGTLIKTQLHDLDTVLEQESPMRFLNNCEIILPKNTKIALINPDGSLGIRRSLTKSITAKLCFDEEKVGEEVDLPSNQPTFFTRLIRLLCCNDYDKI